MDLPAGGVLPDPPSATALPLSASPGADRPGHDGLFWLTWGLVATAVAWLAWHAARYDFVCDDAYISLVYARNLAEHGELVFNLGDRVEPSFFRVPYKCVCLVEPGRGGGRRGEPFERFGDALQEAGGIGCVGHGRCSQGMA